MDRVTDAALRRQRQIQTVLVFVILATLPCYCLGALLLLTSGGSRPSRTPTVVSITVTVQGVPTNTLYPSITPVTFQPPTPTSIFPIVPTPTQINLFPTVPVFPTLTWTPYRPPSPTPFIPSPTAIIIVLPSTTPLPTVALPTLTPIKVGTATHTNTPTATSTFLPTLPPSTPTRAGGP